MKKLAAISLLAALSFSGALFASQSLWSGPFRFDGNAITEEAILLKPDDPLGYSSAMAEGEPKSLTIKVDELVPFDDHPYKVIDNDDMDELTESIKEHGVLNPLIVRPIEETVNSYEIISGHRRYHAAQKLGLKKLPCTVHYVDRDTATVMMVDSNCQRTELLPSEKAKAYKMKMDAMSRQGKRTDLQQESQDATTSRPMGAKSRGNRTDEMIAAQSGDSARQISRFIRLTYLVPELLQFVDDGKISMRPAVEMSYLDVDTQRNIVDCIDEREKEVFPSHAQARCIRQQAENGGISYEQIAAIMDEQKPNQKQTYKISEDRITEMIGRRLTPKEFDDYVMKALDYYHRYLQKQRDIGAR